MSDTEKTTARVVRDGFERACKAFTDRIQSFGFNRSNKAFWVQRSEFTASFIHARRGGISYGAAMNASVHIRLHLGIRVLNDPFDAVALNGPHSASGGYDLPASPNYHLRFNASTGSTFDRCVGDLVRFVEQQGLPWFSTFSQPQVLLDHPKSPLAEDAKKSLRAALDGQIDQANYALSGKLLGVKPVSALATDA
ncbi:hypothetical protein [Piscinibacter sp. HJYY11]|uniref:hypothetical protein n=1 Tax=Piscinibacter sp. HJYY11 TaxID=2801333 RepID=UPI00191D9537|nr:hypothetical protein [Piscinibacter sp. HJYY11]MBL0729659.1 hypothetical protein [Piscinibacter sp. HJYY11]